MTPRQIIFDELPPHEVLGLAIQGEARNAARFDALARHFTGQSPALETVFRDLAAEEQAHGARLQSTYQTLFGGLDTHFAPEQVDRMPEGFLFPPREDIDPATFTPLAALEMALEAEEAAVRLYRELARRAANPTLKFLFQDLAQFEGEHSGALKDALKEISA